MALTWTTTLIKPLPIGGAARATAVLDPGAGTLTRVVALLGAGPAPHAGDPTFLVLELFPQGEGRFEGSIFGAPRDGLTVTWFAQVDGAWHRGPVYADVILPPTFQVRFPWIKTWLVDRLRDVALALPPFLTGKDLAITVAFPRSIQGLPALNVQVDALNPSTAFDGDLLEASVRAGEPLRRGRLYSLNASLVGWCLTPEDRDRLSRWLVQAVEVILDAARHTDFLEPACSFEESEDFSTLEVPLFLVTARFSASVLAELTTPVASSTGHLVA